MKSNTVKYRTNEFLNSGFDPPTAIHSSSIDEDDTKQPHPPEQQQPKLDGFLSRVKKKYEDITNDPHNDTTRSSTNTTNPPIHTVDRVPGNIQTSSHSNNTNMAQAPPSKNEKKLDQYGFITNLDSQGLLRDDLFPTLPGGADTPLSSEPNHDHTLTPRELRMQKKLMRRRERKWVDMLSQWDAILLSPPKLTKMRSRVRKGVPNVVRGKAWARISKASLRASRTRVGVYDQLVAKSCGGGEVATQKQMEEEEEEEYDDSKRWYDVDGNSIVGSKGKKYGDLEQDEMGLGVPLLPSATSNQNSNPTNTDEHEHERIVTKETIERDINRTFPRHSMFYDSASDDSDSGQESSTDTSYDRVSIGDSCSGVGDDVGSGIGDKGGGNMAETGGWIGTVPECTRRDEEDGEEERPASPLGMDGPTVTTSTVETVPGPSTAEARAVVAANAAYRNKGTTRVRNKRRGMTEEDLRVAKGGQAMLRRVLRAYSVYDEEVGYCQGMNFIAAMFITFVSEEEAFWLLVAIMQDNPCQMRGLFGEGMSEAHQVLYVAQKLITQFFPRLSKHLQAENVDITMFATQWLLTMYTSSFPFDIVTRVWDCFLVEGWKVAYRVMLALLDGASGDLMKLKFEDILGYLKELPHRVDAGELLEATFKIPLRKRHIAKYAKQWEKMQRVKKKPDVR